MKSTLTLITLLILTFTSSFGQKVKYKDLFPDLEQRKFNKVEPLLRTFLQEEKNADHPNGNYQMGLIKEANFSLQDVLTDTADLFLLGNEAASFFQTALDNIDEKEIKKNEKYYQSFFRRDLRTGEFGIKLSDVHLDIEKKIEAINNRMQAVRDFHSAVEDLSQIEAEMLTSFNGYVSTSDGLNDFLMSSDLEAISTIGDLQSLAKNFDDKAKATLEVEKILGVSDYYNSIEYQEIGSFKELSPLMPNSTTVIKTWNFSEWAVEVKKLLNTEIFESKDQLIEIDKEINQDVVRIKGGAKTINRTEVPSSLSTKIEKYDPSSIALGLLEAKLSKNLVTLLSDTAINRTLLDSSLVVLQLKMSDSIVNHLNSIKSRLSFSGRDLSRASRYYDQYFSTSFGSVDKVKDFAMKTINWADKMLVQWDTLQNYWQIRNNWGLTATDTIPLRRVEEGDFRNYVTSGFLEFPGDTIISWGVKQDSLLGFVAKFGPDRKVVWEGRFESEAFLESNPLMASDTLSSNNESISFYLFADETPKEKDLVVVNFSLDGSITWSADASAGKKPEYTAYSPAIQETTIFLYPQEEYPLPSGELGYIVIDRNGKIR